VSGVPSAISYGGAAALFQQAGKKIENSTVGYSGETGKAAKGSRFFIKMFRLVKSAEP
jgi:hypothetical protein